MRQILMKLNFWMVCLLLVCCSSSEPTPELVKLFGDYCESIGHVKGSPEFNECVIKIGQKK